MGALSTRVDALRSTGLNDDDVHPPLSFLLQVFLYKRAQIFAGDLFGAFGGRGLGAFHDIDQITMFADYRCEHKMQGGHDVQGFTIECEAGQSAKGLDDNKHICLDTSLYSSHDILLTLQGSCGAS